MWLTRSAIFRPVTIIMVVISLMVLGYTSMSKMGIDLIPKIDIPYINITTIYPGAGPEEIETTVTKPIEDSVSLISKLKNVTSTSQEGVSSVVLEFELGTNLEAAAADVREKLSATRGQLPRDIDDPIVTKADISGMPVYTFGLSSPRPPREIRDIADQIIKHRLARVPGVASVGVSGGDVREIQVAVDKGRLEAYGISISKVNQALLAENLNLPSGTFTEGNKEYSVRALGEFKSLDDIENIQLQLQNGVPIKLKDVAAVTDTVAERRNLTRLNGKDSVTIAILKQSGANTVAVVDGVKRELEALTGQRFLQPSGLLAKWQKPPAMTSGLLPSDIRAQVGYDQSTEILNTIAEVRISLVLGALLAVFIVFLFLHNIRGTVIVGIAIPTSIVATFTPIYFADFTLNMMVLLALSLSVGILVDDSIVVLENIWRHLRLGDPPREAALNGRTEIGLAAMTITFVDVVVFVPIAFMGGIVGQFFRQFGITVATATLFSLFISFTLTPMLASRWFRKEDTEEENAAPKGYTGRLFHAFDRFYAGLDRRYRSVLDWALSHRAATVFIGLVVLLSCMGIVGGGPTAGAGFIKLLIVIAVLALLGLLLSRGSGRWALAGVAVVFMLLMQIPHKNLGFEMFPRTDAGRFSVSIEMPAGTALAATDKVSREIENYLLDKKRFPEVENVFATIGATSQSSFTSQGRDTSLAEMSVVLVKKEQRKRSDLDIMGQVAKWAGRIPGPRIKTMVTEEMGGGGGAPIQISLSGENLEDLTAAGQRTMGLLKKTKGLKDVDISWKVGRPELQAKIDRVALADKGLSTFEVASALRTSLEGSTDSQYREKGLQYDIRVQLRKPDRFSLEDIGRTLIASNPGPVRLEDVATLSIAPSPNKIERRNRIRALTVSADLLPGFTEGIITTQLKSDLKKTNLKGVSWSFIGETEMREESFGNTFAALALSVILVYILMAALFEGYLSPFIIMFSLPMALVGALLALVITGATMSIIAMVGIIMLMGLVTKNAILLVDYTNTLRGRGLERREAILQAGPTRLRPIMMTTMAMIFGMLPTAAPGVFRLVSGAEWRAPMAATVIGGLLVSTMLTLLVIPVLYTVFDDVGSWFTRLVQRILRRAFP